MIDRLRQALDERYRLERELGRGGMATVYLAEDLKHHRAVAVKVLNPDISAALGPERFLREIEIAAGLDHPHILPLYDSGEADGFLYYVMPYIEGGSLRDRLDREKQLPVDDALEIAREVADALSYAHGHDVVHRDIKPENIMLAGGHARVADFGIARAVSAAGSQRLTRTGVMIGTPLYMSPEQAAGDAAIDGRSDLYSLGCVLYEMLAGRPPFTGPPDSIIRQHLTAEPRAITSLRPAVPAQVAAAIMRALAKTPADRFSPAGQFADALRVPVAQSQPVQVVGARPAWRTPVFGAALAFAVLAVVVGGWVAARALGIGSGESLRDSGVIGERERIVLADFEDRTTDSSPTAVTVTELLRVGLSRSQTVSVVDPSQVSRILQMMRRDLAAGLPADVAMEVAARDGMKAVITGEVASIGSGLSLTARLVSVNGDVLVAETETAASEDQLTAAVDRLSARLRERFGDSLRNIRASLPLDRVTTGSIRALRTFSQGLQAFNQGDNARALQLIDEAIAEDSTFAMAYRKLAIMLSNQDEQRSRAVWAAQKAYEHRDRLTDRERYIVTAAYHTVVTGDVDQQISAYRTVLDLYPDDTYALNNLGVLYSWLRDYERSSGYYASALAVDSTNRLHYSNLAASLARERMFDSADVVAHRFANRFPANPEVKLAFVINRAMRQDYDSAAALVPGLLADQRGTVFWEGIAYEWWGHLDALRGQLGSARRRWVESFRRTEARGLEGTWLTRAARRSMLEGLLLENPSRGRELLDEALTRFPLATLNPLDRPYGHLAMAYAAAGEVERANALLAEYEATPEADHSREGRLWMYGARGVIALAEGRTHEAVAAFRQFDQANECATCAAAWLGRAWDAAAESDSAVAAFTRFVDEPSPALWYDAAHTAHAYQRLGELWEARGDAGKAAEYYTRLLTIMKEPDAELRPRVEAVRAAVQRLAADSPAPRGQP